MMFHKNLTPERWFQLSLMEQLANVGSDVERIIKWRNKGDEESSKIALFRALELLDLTIIDPKNKKRRKEPLRIKECLVDYFMYDNQYGFTDKAWQKYFLYFAYAVIAQRRRVTST